MAEASHTSQMTYDLDVAKGRGPKLFAATTTVSNAETFDTGLDTVESISLTEVEATDGDANTPMAYFDELSAGTLTFQIAKLGDYTDLTDEVMHIIILGSVR